MLSSLLVHRTSDLVELLGSQCVSFSPHILKACCEGTQEMREEPCRRERAVLVLHLMSKEWFEALVRLIGLEYGSLT